MTEPAQDHGRPTAVAPRETIVTLEDVTFGYGSRPVVEAINLDVYRDDFLAIVGPNGGGKTTLLRLMLGLLQPRSGRIRIFGAPPRETRSRIGYVPQRPRFEADFPATVEEIVLTGRLGHRGIGRRYNDEDRQAAQKAIEELDLKHLAGRSINALSGGERQRTLVARALSSQPDMLLMDEPTSSVDSRVEKSFYELLRDLHRRIPIVLVSHDLGFVSAYVTRVACVNRRLVVTPVDEVHVHDVEALYEGPVRMWSHSCEL